MSTERNNIPEVDSLACEKIGSKYAVALSAGTAALHMAVKLAGVKLGDKVFCSDMTFAATVNPITYEGGVPVFIDTEYDTWNMDPVALERAFELYPDVKLIVVAHLYGTPGKIDEIKAIALRMQQSRWELPIKESKQEHLVILMLFLLMAIKL